MQLLQFRPPPGTLARNLRQVHDELRMLCLQRSSLQPESAEGREWVEDMAVAVTRHFGIEVDVVYRGVIKGIRGDLAGESILKDFLADHWRLQILLQRARITKANDRFFHANWTLLEDRLHVQMADEEEVVFPLLDDATVDAGALVSAVRDFRQRLSLPEENRSSRQAKSARAAATCATMRLIVPTRDAFHT